MCQSKSKNGNNVFKHALCPYPGLHRSTHGSLYDKFVKLKLANFNISVVAALVLPAFLYVVIVVYHTAMVLLYILYVD